MLNRVEAWSLLEEVAVVCEVPYSPVLLLESSFDASMTESDEFREACQSGFDEYFEFMYEFEKSGQTLVFVPRVYSWGEVVELVVDTALREDTVGYITSRDWRAGFGLGWLSALALVKWREAVMGLKMLTALLVLGDAMQGGGFMACHESFTQSGSEGAHHTPIVSKVGIGGTVAGGVLPSARASDGGRATPPPFADGN